MLQIRSTWVRRGIQHARPGGPTEGGSTCIRRHVRLPVAVDGHPLDPREDGPDRSARPDGHESQSGSEPPAVHGSPHRLVIATASTPRSILMASSDAPFHPSEPGFVRHRLAGRRDPRAALPNTEAGLTEVRSPSRRASFSKRRRCSGLERRLQRGAAHGEDRAAPGTTRRDCSHDRHPHGRWFVGQRGRAHPAPH